MVDPSQGAPTTTPPEDGADTVPPGEIGRRIILCAIYFSAVAVAVAFSPAVGLLRLASHVK